MSTPAKTIVNAMSVDVEDYFQVSAFESVVSRDDWDKLESRVERNTHRLLNIFDAHAVRSTFFTLGWVAQRYPGLVKEIAGRGHEIASHGYEHRLIYDQTPDAFREDVKRAKAVLEDASGQHVVGYRAPSYSVTTASLWALDVLAEEGYSYDSSIFPIRHDRYGIPSAPRHPHVLKVQTGALVEAPASTVRLGSTNLPVAGGGYFRILPYWWTRWGIARVNNLEHRPAIFYLHPWEIDPEQPRMPGGALSRFRHYRNLDRTESRLHRLLTDFKFDTMASLLKTARLAPSNDLAH